jgi:hypothetical protein
VGQFDEPRELPHTHIRYHICCEVQIDQTLHVAYVLDALVAYGIFGDGELDQLVQL